MYENYLKILAIGLLIFGCQKPFVPKTDRFPPDLVIEGYLSTQGDVQSVLLSYSFNFGERQKYNSEKGATVYVTDEQGDRYNYYETDRTGDYRTDSIDQVRGIVGHTYILHVETGDGNIYESTPQKIVECGELSTVTCKPGREEVLTEDAYGDPLEIYYNGFEIDVSSNGILNAGNFYQYAFDGYEEHFTKVPDAVLLGLYEHRRLSMNYLSVIRTGNADGVTGHAIHNKKLLFIPYYYLTEFTPSYIYIDTMTFDSLHPPPPDLGFYLPSTDTNYITYFKGLLFRLELRSLTSEAYDFWSGAENQLNATGSLFDPAASQINGNMHCVNDPGKKVYGIFTVYDMKKKFSYMYYDGQHSYSKEIDSFPEIIVDTFKVDTMPEGWINPPF